ncbi:MAG TPA: hypothetical protein PK493_20690, partial [Pseudomonadota bacterium]|nr:hypothetical protein [Pseudomonadota bacterium]
MRRYQLKRAGVSAALCVSALTVAMSSAWAQGAAQTGAPDPASVPPTTGMTQIPPPPPYPLVPGGDAAAVATPVPAQVAAAPVPTPPPPAQPSTPPPAPPPYSLPFG